MKVANLDGNLAVFLPPAVVGVLGLKEGDDVEIHLNGDRSRDIEVTNRRLRALETLRSLQRSLPPHFKFDREVANARDGLSRWLDSRWFDSNGKPVMESESTPDSREGTRTISQRCLLRKTRN